MSQWKDHEIEATHDLAVVIGRFQPFHHGHKALIEFANVTAKRTLVLIGSSFIARNSKNPFSAKEREQMIRSNFDESTNARIEFDYITDDLYNDQHWIASVQNAISNVDISEENQKVCIVGNRKDDSSYYLDLFPEYSLHECPHAETLHATQIRANLFEQGTLNDVPEGTKFFIHGWIASNKEEFNRLKEEHLFVLNYKKQFETLPYPPIFVTSDAVVINNGHILLVKRRAAPGKGLWALPGGFLNANERIEDCIIRELLEETRIKVHPAILKTSLKGTHVFDAPGRSLRGRTITHAGLFVLNEKTLPRVRGSDDAEKAKWFPISEFYEMSDMTYEDHYSIGTYMINRAG